MIKRLAAITIAVSRYTIKAEYTLGTPLFTNKFTNGSRINAKSHDRIIMRKISANDPRNEPKSEITCQERVITPKNPTIRHSGNFSNDLNIGCLAVY
jgi:hypothetical protein